jgi:hypothetical protein
MELDIKDCSEIGFKHLWEDDTSPIVFLNDPPSYPPKRRKCVNCGREEVLRVTHSEEWILVDNGVMTGDKHE